MMKITSGGSYQIAAFFVLILFFYFISTSRTQQINSLTSKIVTDDINIDIDQSTKPSEECQEQKKGPPPTQSLSDLFKR